MSAATPEQLERLEPYVLGAQPDARGEIDIHCPLHGDSRRSASINPAKGVWFCHAGCGGGSIRQLVGAEDTWKPVPESARRQRRSVIAARATEEPFDDNDVHRWHDRLLDDRKAIDQLLEKKGVKVDTAIRALLGYNGRHFKIPVYGPPPEREIWNVRTYDMRPTNGRRKIWSVRGMGQARLYPIGPLTRSVKHETVLFCEGEWDTLLALQAGYLAVTRTDGAGKPWHEEWTEFFEDRRVVIVPDRDIPGIEDATKTHDALADVAQSIRFINLPFKLKKKDGEDLSDLLLSAERADWYVMGNLIAGADNTIKEEI
jgi:hypothetical protein